MEVDALSTQVLGAFTTTFGSFLIPALAWNLYYNSDERIKQMPKPTQTLSVKSVVQRLSAPFSSLVDT